MKVGDPVKKQIQYINPTKLPSCWGVLGYRLFLLAICLKVIAFSEDSVKRTLIFASCVSARFSFALGLQQYAKYSQSQLDLTHSWIKHMYQCIHMVQGQGM